jgi:transposase
VFFVLSTRDVPLCITRGQEKSRRAPIELLPDREAQTRQPWLQAHPGVELISRARAAQYAEGARAGAPQAVQVADRWHVLKNLGEAGKRVLTRQRASVEHAARPMRTDQLGQLPTAGDLSVRFSARPETEIEQHCWSKGPVEGHIDRLKTIKRQMYGQANFSSFTK